VPPAFSLALPGLGYFMPNRTFGAPATPVKRRMVCICTPLGLHPDFFFPEKEGTDYELTPYLEVLKEFRETTRSPRPGAQTRDSSLHGFQAGGTRPCSPRGTP